MFLFQTITKILRIKGLLVSINLVNDVRAFQTDILLEINMFCVRMLDLRTEHWEIVIKLENLNTMILSVRHQDVSLAIYSNSFQSFEFSIILAPAAKSS